MMAVSAAIADHARDLDDWTAPRDALFPSLTGTSRGMGRKRILVIGLIGGGVLVRVRLVAVVPAGQTSPSG
jgi:hypothetical protein